MKLRFFYHWNYYQPVYGHPPYLLLKIGVTGAREEILHQFKKYLLSGLLTDFSENRFGEIEETLLQVRAIEQRGLDEFETGGQGFTHHITRSRVRFEHSVFGKCPEWPIWCCTLAQYKAALEGYRRFLDMPKSIDSELIVQLPDGEPPDC